MKKTFVKVISLALALVTLTCLFASCGNKLSGTYAKEETEFGIKTRVAYTFKGDKVTIELEIAGESVEVEGTYKIDDDEITIEIESDNDLLDGIDGTFDFEKGKGYIEIEDVKYEKE